MRFSFLISIYILFNFYSFSQVGIGTTTPQSILDVQSTTSGILIPRMTETQRGLIAPLNEGLLVYQNDGDVGFYYFNGANWGKVLDFEDGGLEFITETTMGGAFSGHRLRNANPDFYGVIGDNAIDLSNSTALSTTNGATGLSSFAAGQNVTASGRFSFAMGRDSQALDHNTVAMGRDAVASQNNAVAIGFGCEASGLESVAMGNLSQASGNRAVAMGNRAVAAGEGSFSMTDIGNANEDFAAILGGRNNEANGQQSAILGGQDLTVNSLSEVAVGQFNTNIPAVVDNVTYDERDRAFSIGIGSGVANRVDGLEVFKNGTIYADELEITEITDDKQLVTKEYVDNFSEVRIVDRTTITPVRGTLIIDTNDNILKIYNGAAWVNIVTGV